jgi:hypothetical protein
MREIVVESLDPRLQRRTISRPFETEQRTENDGRDSPHDVLSLRGKSGTVFRQNFCAIGNATDQGSAPQDRATDDPDLQKSTPRYAQSASLGRPFPGAH